jgi:hypothetical protein
MCFRGTTPRRSTATAFPIFQTYGALDNIRLRGAKITAN